MSIPSNRTSPTVKTASTEDRDPRHGGWEGYDVTDPVGYGGVLGSVH